MVKNRVTSWRKTLCFVRSLVAFSFWECIMAKLNIPVPSLRTAEGGKAQHINAVQQLRRAVSACLLWEDSFYEDGQSIGERIAALIPTVPPLVVAELAIEARESFKLRHVPLLLVREMARHKTHRSLVSQTLSRVIQRADELAEFLAIYWSKGKTPLSAQVKKGLAEAFTKFDAYALAKYNRDGAIKLRDVLFLCHAKPKDDAQALLWRQLIDKTLPVPDTWEVALSAGGAKKKAWERLLSENKLGALALLRNLRNMQQAGVADDQIIVALQTANAARVLPFRFIAAAKHAPALEPYLEEAMFKCLAQLEKLPGKTLLLIDVSSSMWYGNVSRRSDLLRIDAACGVAMLTREVCERVEVFTFSQRLAAVPPRRGFALSDAIAQSQPHSSTLLGAAVQVLNEQHQYDRLIVFTDEQSHDRVPAPTGKGYLINVSVERNGVGYGPWTHIDGFSEATLRFIQELENPLTSTVR